MEIKKRQKRERKWAMTKLMPAHKTAEPRMGRHHSGKLKKYQAYLQLIIHGRWTFIYLKKKNNLMGCLSVALILQDLSIMIMAAFGTENQRGVH